MTLITDQEYLKSEQYKNAANLQARINLHQRFGTNHYGWSRWVFEQLELENRDGSLFLLEVGSGPGSLWWENRERFPDGFRACLGDLSNGMAAEARRVLAALEGFFFCALDAQNIPARAGSFDIVVANHMLYHIPNLPQALGEIQRVLKPGGLLMAATNGLEHMAELDQLILGFEPRYSSAKYDMRKYALDNAHEILEAFFVEIEIRCYEENLLVTEVEPLLAYIFSMWGLGGGPDDAWGQQFEQYIRREFNARGGKFFITKSQGVVLGHKPG